jgi:hypothetical protein
MTIFLTRYLLVRTLHLAERLAEAETEYRAIIEDARTHLGDHPYRWSFQVGLAQCRMAQKDPEEAERLLLEALTHQEDLAGAGGGDAQFTRDVLVQLYDARKEPDKASLYRRK